MANLSPLSSYIAGLKDGAWTVVSSPKRVMTTFLFTASLFVGFVYLSFPSYSLQMIKAGPYYAGTAYTDLLMLMIETGGYSAVGLALIYSSLTVMLLHLIYLRSASSSGSLGQAIVAIPGTLAAGCASCGAGVIGLISGVGGITITPLVGGSLQVVSIVLLLVAISRLAPNTKSCSVNYFE